MHATRLLATITCLVLCAPAPAFSQSLDDFLKRSVEDVVRKATKPDKKKQQPTSQDAPASATAVPAVASPGTVPILKLQAAGKPQVMWSSASGFRDWGDIAVAGGLVVGANMTGNGGLFAFDQHTGERRWVVSNRNTSGAAPATDGKHAAIAWGRELSLAAYRLSDGQQVWTKRFDPVDDGAPVLVGSTVVAQHEDGFLYAFDLASGAERWKFQYAPKENWCAAGRPALADGVLYISSGLQPPSNPRTDFFLHAVDAQTGRELWRFNPESRYPKNYGACLVEIVVAGDTVVAASDEFLFGVDRATGRLKYRVDTHDGTREAKLGGLVAHDGVVYGVTTRQFQGIDAATGRTLWAVPGEFQEHARAIVVGNGAVYFQGRIEGIDPPDGMWVLHALDLKSRQLRWSYANPTGLQFTFGPPVIVDGDAFVAINSNLLRLR